MEWRLNDRLDKVGAQATAPASSSHPAPSAQPASAQTEQEDPAGLLENAQKAIGELIDQLKARNLGGQATKVLIKHRWMRDHTPPDPTPADLQRPRPSTRSSRPCSRGVRQDDPQGAPGARPGVPEVPLPFAIPSTGSSSRAGVDLHHHLARLRLRPFFPRLPLFFFFGLQILGIAYTKPGDYDFLPEFVRDFVEPVSYSEVALIWLNVVGWMVGFFAWMVWMGQLHPADVKLSYRDHAYHAVGKFFLLLTGVGGILWVLAWARELYHPLFDPSFGNPFLIFKPITWRVLDLPVYQIGFFVLSAFRVLAAYAWLGAVVYERVPKSQADEMRWSRAGGRRAVGSGEDGNSWDTQEERREDRGGQGGREERPKRIGHVYPPSATLRVSPEEADRPPPKDLRQRVIDAVSSQLVLPQHVLEGGGGDRHPAPPLQGLHEGGGGPVPEGVLLEGPPGTGKTSVARFIALFSGLHFVTASPWGTPVQVAGRERPVHPRPLPDRAGSGSLGALPGRDWRPWPPGGAATARWTTPWASSCRRWTAYSGFRRGRP